MKIAIYPGSFDPPTLGHLDIIERASGIFDRLIVACMTNRRKKTLFCTEERLEMLREITKGMAGVEVDGSGELLAAYAKVRGAAVIVKGLRAMSDFEMEFQMALLNRKMNPELDTLFLAAGDRFHYLSSSAVKEIGALGGDISDFVPPAILGKVKDVICQA